MVVAGNLLKNNADCRPEVEDWILVAVIVVVAEDLAVVPHKEHSWWWRQSCPKRKDTQSFHDDCVGDVAYRDGSSSTRCIRQCYKSRHSSSK